MVEVAVEAALTRRRLEAPAVPTNNVHTPQTDIQHDNSNTVMQESAGEAEVPQDDMPHYDNTVLQEAVSPPAADAPTDIPSFNTDKCYLGKLCPRGHDYAGTGQSLRNLKGSYCLACNTEQVQAKRQRKPS